MKLSGTFEAFLPENKDLVVLVFALKLCPWEVSLWLELLVQFGLLPFENCEIYMGLFKSYFLVSLPTSPPSESEGRFFSDKRNKKSEHLIFKLISSN